VAQVVALTTLVPLVTGVMELPAQVELVVALVRPEELVALEARLLLRGCGTNV
jgi:hypothetical protein